MSIKDVNNMTVFINYFNQAGKTDYILTITLDL